MVEVWQLYEKSLFSLRNLSGCLQEIVREGPVGPYQNEQKSAPVIIELLKRLNLRGTAGK